jgi:CRISPR-associated protein Cmr2
MSSLLAISVGPVQEIVAASRRTRDLWFGSYVLSEISRAAAKEVEAQGGTLIFPASSNADNVANLILAELRAEENPKDVAAQAKGAAQGRWLAFAHDAEREARGVLRSDVWNDQIHDVVQFYAAWVSSSKDYRADRARVMRLLAGRKNCPDFRQPKFNNALLPKSSLDGQRPTVLVGLKAGESPETYRDHWPAELRQKLRLAAGEQLDAVGVVKRLGKRQGESHRHFPAIVRVAAEDGLLGIEEGDPCFAVIVADGDKIGEALLRLKSADDHRTLSQALAGFASEARKVVNAHHGVLIYSGGDDVVAFVPVHTCLSCARSLHDRFADVPSEHGSLTLSVGVAIGGFLENWEDVLEYGRAALKAAKQVAGKDALAVHLHQAGSTCFGLRERWESELDRRLYDFAALIRDGRISSQLPYELRRLAELYEPWPVESASAATEGDLVRLIARKQSQSTGTVREAWAQYLNGMSAQRLRTLAEELLIARQLAAALGRAEKRPAALTGAVT